MIDFPWSLTRAFHTSYNWISSKTSVLCSNNLPLARAL
jgi:hypothetical protein